MISRKNILTKYLIILLILVLLGVVCVVKLFILTTVERNSLLTTWEKLQAKDSEVVAPRGEIFDCNGNKLAITEQRYRFYFDPKSEPLHKVRKRKINPDDPHSAVEEYTYFNDGIDSLSISLAELFGGSAQEYKRKILEGKSKNNRHLALVKRTISHHEKELISTFPIFRRGKFAGGLIIEKSDHASRNYLYGDMARRTIGNVNVFGGIMGIEYCCNANLTGVNGLENRQKISRTQTIRVPKKEPIPGDNIHTTLNIDYQEICTQALLDNLAVYPAEQVCLVLMEVKSGAIRALVNLQRDKDGKYTEMGPIQTNMALSDLSNPGSTFKSVSLMIAFEDGKCDSSTMVCLEGGQKQYYNHIMKDDHQVRPDTVNLKRVLAESSNVGVSKIINQYYAKTEESKLFINSIESLGFGKTQLTLGFDHWQGVVGIPQVPQVGSKKWSGISIPWLSIGYEILVPPIYTLMFYNAIANEGKMIEPYLIESIENANGGTVWKWSKKVVNPKICSNNTLKQIQGMLEGVVEKGTASSIKNSTVKIAGKTGTAQLKDSKREGYPLQLTFCGYFPADAPQYSCIVVYKRPQKLVYPRLTSCLVFKNVAERITSIEGKRTLATLEKWGGDTLKTANLPQVKAGAAKEIYNALDALAVKKEKVKSEFIRIKPDEQHLKLEAGEYVQKDAVVPNVIGMGASDALYILEKAGLNVQLYGYGTVVAQSIHAGEPIKVGNTISLTLSNK